MGTLGDHTVRLNNGVEMPRLGLGMYQLSSGEQAVGSVRIALKSGYRHFDTAAMYGNERDLGTALREMEVPRENVFVTTKLWNTDHGYENALRAFKTSLEKLGLNFVDLYLIHWPVQGRRRETWKALLKLLEEGKCRAIGVSNYTIRHLKELLDESPIVPAVNQVEFSPFLFQKELLEFCSSHDIQLEAYSPLTKSRRINDQTISSFGKKYGKTPAQIMIRWVLQHNVVAIPKSANERHIRENAEVFDFNISDEDMAKLDTLNEGLRVSWDPSSVV